MKTLVTTTLSNAENNAEKILKKPYARRLVPDEVQGFTATIQEFPGCIAEGDTAEEALKNLDAAASSWVSVSLAHGREIREPIDFEGCSGKLALRIPRGLHREIAELADLESCSINQLLNVAIASYVGGKQMMRQVSKMLQTAIPPVHNVNVCSVNDRFQIQQGMGYGVFLVTAGESPFTHAHATLKKALTNSPLSFLENANG